MTGPNPHVDYRRDSSVVYASLITVVQYLPRTPSPITKVIAKA